MTAKLLIDGRWQESVTALDATSPATGEVLGTVCQGTRADAARAVEAAGAAFPAWAARSPFDRARLLHEIADAIAARREQLARGLALDQGRPIHAEGYAEVDEVADYFRMSAEDAVRLEGALPASRDPEKRVMLVRRALGPVAVISPWNWPYLMAAEMIAPALACGNTVVWTPAPTTSLCSAMLAEAIATVPLPPGVLNFVTGPGPEVGDEIAGHPATAMVTFVGSTETGATVARRAAGKPQLLELGNNGPMVVMAGADLDRAVDAAMVGCFMGSGQSCTAAERLLVHESIREEFVERMRIAIAGVRLGDPLDPDTTMGPLNNEEVAAKMDRHVEDAVERGAEVVCGGRRSPERPTALYWEPTLLDGVAPESATANEETFGPIAPVMPVRSLDEAISETNRLGYGLAAAIFTPDVIDGLRFADRVSAGVVNVNETSNYFEIHLPFGGGPRSSSGFGRTGGRHILEEMTALQTVTVTP